MAAKKQGGLGRGLDALLGKKLEDRPRSGASEGFLEVDIAKLVPGKYQPRTRMDEESLKELAASIKTEGVISPILVRKVSDGSFEIVAGERRYRAAMIAGLKKVPVIVRKISNDKALTVALIENIQRENLNPLEEALGIERLVGEFGMTHETASQAVGKSRSAVTNLLRLLKLTEPVQALLMDGKISMGHARALLALDDKDQIALAGEVVEKDLSVRQTEAAINRMKKSAEPPRAKLVPAGAALAEEKLSGFLGTPVKVSANRKGKGRLVIEFADYGQLEGIVSRFGLKL